MWWHPWLLVERRTRAVLADRLSSGASQMVDAVLAKMIAERKRLARAGWFHPGISEFLTSTIEAAYAPPVDIRVAAKAVMMTLLAVVLSPPLAIGGWEEGHAAF